MTFLRRSHVKIPNKMSAALAIPTTMNTAATAPLFRKNWPLAVPWPSVFKVVACATTCVTVKATPLEVDVYVVVYNEGMATEVWPSESTPFDF